MRRLDFPLTALVAALALAATLLHAGWPLAEGAAIRDGELWRLVTGPLVHSSAGQLLRDAAGWTILGAAYEAELGRRRFALLALGGLVVPVAAIAWLQPDMPLYYGLSGAVYALLAHAVVLEWRRGAGRPPRWVVGLALVSGAKLLFEAVTGRLLFPMELGDGIVPATMAHLVGAAFGAAAAVTSTITPTPTPTPTPTITTTTTATSPSPSPTTSTPTDGRLRPRPPRATVARVVLADAARSPDAL